MKWSVIIFMTFILFATNIIIILAETAQAHFPGRIGKSERGSSG
jgi:VanZ family protein